VEKLISVIAGSAEHVPRYGLANNMQVTRDWLARALPQSSASHFSNPTNENPPEAGNSDGLSWGKTRHLVQGHRKRMLLPDSATHKEDFDRYPSAEFASP
jgi:hypothetical protein